MSCLWLLAWCAGGVLPPPVPVREVRLVMGTPAEVAVSGAPAPRAALDAAFAALQRVDDEMTLWRPSPLTRLNAAGHGIASVDLLAVLAHALDVAAASGGAFDPTVEPLVRAAGQLGQPAQALDPPALRRMLARVGAANVRLDTVRNEVRLLRGARIDLGGIAKGYAADRALLALRASGARAAVIDLGGSSLKVFGRPLDVEAADPSDRSAAPWGSFRIDGEALGTSGTSERGAHILDPRSGRPSARVLAATVVAPDAMEADALSTALFVLGPEEGLPLLERRGASGFVLLREGRLRLLRSTRGFAAAHALKVAPGVELREDR